MQAILRERFCSHHYAGMINSDINGRETLHVGQYSSLEHVVVSISSQMLEPSDMTVNNTKAVPQLSCPTASLYNNILHYTTHTPTAPPPINKFCTNTHKKNGNHMRNVFFSRPTCLSRTAMTPGLTQICLLEENSAARMAYHTNVQCCPRLLSFERINNDPQQFGTLYFQYKIQPVMLHFTCDISFLANITIN